MMSRSVQSISGSAPERTAGFQMMVCVQLSFNSCVPCTTRLQSLYQRLFPARTGSGNHPGQDEGSRVKLGPQNLVRRRGKRPRHFCKYDSAEERGHISTAKFLPPGTILDYLELCRTENPSLKIGRKVFTRVPWLYRVGRQPNFGRHPASRTGFHVAIFVWFGADLTCQGCGDLIRPITSWLVSAKFAPPGRIKWSVTQPVAACSTFLWKEHAEWNFNLVSLFCWVSSPEVWEESFRDVLFIRQRSQHTRCSICVRHKLVLKRLRRKPSSAQSANGYIPSTPSEAVWG